MFNPAPPNRPIPKLSTSLYRTFAIKAPVSTHFRPATCEEVECKAFTEGWTYKKSDLGEQLLHIVTHSGKRYREVELAGTYLVFEPGQPCFQASSHKVPLDRPEFFFEGRGDYRSFSHRKATAHKPEDWVDSFANHLDQIHTAIERG